MNANHKIVTKDWLRDKVWSSVSYDVIERKPDPNPTSLVVVGRAILAIFNRQTDEEQTEATTTDKNGVGFTAFDAKLATRCARRFQIQGRIDYWMWKIWIEPTPGGYPRICKYWKQLNEVANAKQEKVSS